MELDEKESNLPELFLCMICEKYRPIGELREVKVRNLLFPKLVCLGCFKDIRTTASGGGSDAINAEEDKA